MLMKGKAPTSALGEGFGSAAYALCDRKVLKGLQILDSKGIGWVVCLRWWVMYGWAYAGDLGA